MPGKELSKNYATMCYSMIAPTSEKGRNNKNENNG